MHLITGGSGFVGNRLTHLLSSRGEEVRVLDLWDSPDRPNNVQFVKCDILDPERVEEAMQGAAYVYHTVALVPITKAGKRFWDVNVEGTRVAAQAAIKAGVKSFIHISSSAVFGAPETCPITENTRPSAFESYGLAKLAAEEAVNEAAQAGLRCAILRPRCVLAPGRLGIFQILFEWISEGKAAYIMGNGNQSFQFVHADDLAMAAALCADKLKSGVYNLGTDRFGTLRQALEALIQHAGTGSGIRSVPVGFAIAVLKPLDLLGLSPLSSWHYLTYHKPFWFDITKAKNELGWRPEYSNDEMLAQSYDWFLEHRRTLADQAETSPHRAPVKQGMLQLVKWLS